MVSGLVLAEDDVQKLPQPETKQTKPGPAVRSKVAPGKKKFVLDVVKNAVGLPQSGLQDRLRVLYAASLVIGPLDAQEAKRFAREGVRIEAELISAGEKPAVSMFAAGNVDCTSAGQFVERIPADAVDRAEDSIIAAVSTCSKTAVPVAQRKLETALNQRTLAARALLAVIENVGPKSLWSQTQFNSLFSSLPSGEKAKKDAPDYAAMYNRMAKEMDTDTARDAGLKFLVWLGKLGDSGERNMAINIATDSMKEALGPEKYEEALRSDVMAKQAADLAGQPGEIPPPEEESVSVLMAMDKSGTDRSEELSKMPASLRAREAAASGFASGTEGDKKGAEKYFDLAFSAADEVWSKRTENPRAAEVVEEVSQAAAQVDPVKALMRAQAMQDPSSQALGMLAIARVVAASD